MMPDYWELCEGEVVTLKGDTLRFVIEYIAPGEAVCTLETAIADRQPANPPRMFLMV